MAIETLDDLNQILGQCCCEMPVCPEPSKECESITVTLCGHAIPSLDGVPSEDLCKRFSILKRTLTQNQDRTRTFVSPAGTVRDILDNEAIETLTYSRDEFGDCSLVTINTKDLLEGRDENFGTLTTRRVHRESSNATGVCIGTETVTNTPPGPGDGTTTWTVCTSLSLVIPSLTTFTYLGDGVFQRTTTDGSETTIVWTVEYLNPVVASEELSYFNFPDDAGGEQCESALTCFNATKSRFRWVIPDGWLGSYFKITWDLVFFPETGAPTSVATDTTWQWTGPGDPEDEDTWKSGWYEIDPPDEPGQIRVVNARYECYRSPQFGNKPQVLGEAVEL